MDVMAQMQDWDEAAWCLAAVAVAWSSSAAAEHQAAAADVLAAVGPLELPPGTEAAQLGAQASAPLQQISAVLGGRLDAWMQLPDEALIAQGEASGQLAPAFQHFLLPQLPGLGEALAREGARMLDVGTGVGAIARGFAATFPALHVTGLDVSSRVLEIGATLLAESPVRDRVELREQSVADLDEPGGYDLVWMPAPFVPVGPLREGLARSAKALRPGGCVLLGHGKLSGSTPLQEALSRWKTLAFGGTALDDKEAAAALTEVGLVDVMNVPTPPGAPALTVGRAPGV